MKAILIDNDGNVLSAVQLMSVEGDARRDVITTFEAWATFNAELDEDGNAAQTHGMVLF